ncbi:unnamed protein product [Zymoseptoria tritici ST99CH_1A5]|uniref:Uncharacterized protein n=1 Tax=Zymoseptoria tritici ST99CH_1A5 TaxID=1276529 RepID=A0A1Y6M0N5_ZYMTR|nr:unnamed protein product [Zymoseptoria tritici ST99CH_1A5]
MSHSIASALSEKDSNLQPAQQNNPKSLAAGEENKSLDTEQQKQVLSSWRGEQVPGHGTAQAGARGDCGAAGEENKSLDTEQHKQVLEEIAEQLERRTSLWTRNSTSRCSRRLRSSRRGEQVSRHGTAQAGAREDCGAAGEENKSLDTEQHKQVLEKHKRVLEKIAEQNKQPGTYVSPSDAILSPTSSKLAGFKQRQINRQQKQQQEFHCALAFLSHYKH